VDTLAIDRRVTLVLVFAAILANERTQRLTEFLRHRLTAGVRREPEPGRGHLLVEAQQPRFPQPIMLLSALTPLLLVPFAVAGGVHKLKLKKFPLANNHPSHETAYLAEKYGSQSLMQVPLMGAGGAGRRMRCPANKDNSDLYWAQTEPLGGHGVPLSSKFAFFPPLSHAHNNTKIL
jgi:hypothetical protein